MPTVDFVHSAPYRHMPGLGLMPAIQVELVHYGFTARAAGLLDTGSSFTIFSRQHARVLGIEDVTKGRVESVGTLGGLIHFYSFDMEMIVRFVSGSRRFPAQVGFFESEIRRSILGRNLIFSHFQVGIREREQRIYLRPED